VKRDREEINDPLLEQCNAAIERSKLLLKQIELSLARSRMLQGELDEQLRRWDQASNV